MGEEEGDPPDIFMKIIKKSFLAFALLLLAFPVCPSQAQMTFLEMNGYYRLRYDYLYRLYPKNDPGENIGYFIQRFRLEPTIVAEERVRIKSQIDVLDDTVLGNNSAPAATYLDHSLTGGNTATGIYGDERDTIRVKRVWAEIDSPYGLFRLGRQPFNFGLQAFLNSGDGQTFDFGDSHYGETRDRIAYFSPKTIFLGYGELMLAYDKLIENPYDYKHGEPGGFLGWLTNPTTDLDEYMISYVRKGTIWESGVAASRQIQFQSKTRVWLFDLYGRIKHKYLYAAGEGRFTTGKTTVAGEKLDVNQVGGLLRGGADLVTEDGEFDFGLESGYASGDGSGKGAEQTNFAPDYRVGILLYSEVMDYLTRKAGAASLTRGGIANSVYARSFFKYIYAPRVSVMAGVLWAYPDKVDHIIAGHDSWLGLEIDSGVEVKLTRRSTVGLELGYLFTGDGLEGEFKDPFALRTKFQVVF